MTLLRTFWARITASAWASVVAKTIGFGGMLVALGLLGSGVLDRWLTPRPAAAAVQRGPRSAASLPKHGKPAEAAIELDAEGAATTSSSATAPSSASASASGAAAAARTADGKVILNVAQEKDLEGLPGIGARKAKAILELRAKLGGRFKRLEELMRVRGIKKKFLERLRPHVVLD